MSRTSRSWRSRSKQRGADTSSRLMPPDPGATALIQRTISGTSRTSRHSGHASIPANLLYSAALTSSTGRAARGPMSPRPAGHLIMALSTGPSVDLIMNRVFTSAGSPQPSAHCARQSHASPHEKERPMILEGKVGLVTGAATGCLADSGMITVGSIRCRRELRGTALANGPQQARRGVAVSRRMVSRVRRCRG